MPRTREQELFEILKDPTNYRFPVNTNTQFRNGVKALALERGLEWIPNRGFQPVTPQNTPQNTLRAITPDKPLEQPSSPSQPILHGVKVADQLPNAASIWEKAEKANEADKTLVQKRQSQSIEFPNEPIALCVLSDQHIGAHGADYAAMRHDAQVVAQTDGFYAVLTGDGINNFIVSKLVSARAADLLRVDEQWLALEHYFSFFVDKHGQSRIVAAVSGNHEQWTYKIAGFDHLKNILPKQILYDTDQLEATIKVGAFSSSWLFRHKTKYNSVYNALHGVKQTLRLGSSDPDVLIAAHIHRGAGYEVFYHQDRKRLGILTGTYKTNDAYPRQEGFGGGGKGNCVSVVITPDGRLIPFDDVTSAANHLEMERMKHRMVAR